MHVPMIMNWPGVVPKAKVVREVGSHLDLLPTIVKAAGVAPPVDRTLDGNDAIPLAAADARSTHDAIFWSSGGQLAARRGKWKLVKDGKVFDGTPAGNQALAGDDALFLSNVEEDPGESVNLRRRFPGIVDELATLMEKWAEEVKKW
jgi:arylsulfatase A-like enzyme